MLNRLRNPPKRLVRAGELALRDGIARVQGKRSLELRQRVRVSTRLHVAASKQQSIGEGLRRLADARLTVGMFRHVFLTEGREQRGRVTRDDVRQKSRRSPSRPCNATLRGRAPAGCGILRVAAELS